MAAIWRWLRRQVLLFQPSLWRVTSGARSMSAAFLPRGQGALPVSAGAQKSINPPLVARQANPVQRPVVLVIAFGLDEAMLQRLIAQARPVTEEEPEPVFLIDHADFSSLTKDGVLFEHFPSSISKALLDGDLPWTRYAERRLDLLVAKWRPVSIVPFGKRSLGVLSSWRQRQQR